MRLSSEHSVRIWEQWKNVIKEPSPCTVIIIVILSFPVEHNKPDTIIFRQNVAETAVVMKEHANHEHRQEEEEEEAAKKLPAHLLLKLSPFPLWGLFLLLSQSIVPQADCFPISTAVDSSLSRQLGKSQTVH